MPWYTFELLDAEDQLTGLTTEQHYSFDDVPKIGDRIKIGDQTWMRRFCGQIGTAQVARIAHGYPFRSESLPLDCCPESQDEKGRAIIKSQAHEREVLARTGYIRADPGLHSKEVKRYTEDMKRKGRM